MRKTLLTVIAVMALLFCVDMAQAQGGGGGGNGGGGGGRGGRGGRGNMDPAAMIQMQLAGIKTQLSATDQEWTVLEPLIGDVLKNQPQGGGRGMMGGRNRGGQPADPNAPPNPRAAAMAASNPEQAALQQAVMSDTATPDEIKAKLAAYRAAIIKKAEAVKAAREKLQKVVTVKQEALLVLRGILE
jgi:hypothetical protein